MASTKKEMRRNAVKRAKSVLAKEGNRTKLAGAVLICISLTMIMWLFADLSGIILDMIGNVEEYVYYPVARLSLVILILYLVAPLYVGTFRMAGRMLQGEETEIADMFYTFSSGKAYRRALRLSFKIFWRILPIIIALRIHAIMDFLSYWLVFYDETILAVNIGFIPVALFLVLFVSRSFGLVSFAYFNESMKLRKTRKYARKARRGNYSSICAVAYGTLFKLIFSLLTLGIATVVHTIPLAMLTYGALAEQLKEKFDTKTERIDIYGKQ